MLGSGKITRTCIVVVDMDGKTKECCEGRNSRSTFTVPSVIAGSVGTKDVSFAYVSIEFEWMFSNETKSGKELELVISSEYVLYSVIDDVSLKLICDGETWRLLSIASKANNKSSLYKS